MKGKGPSGPLLPFAMFLAATGIAWIIAVTAIMGFW